MEQSLNPRMGRDTIHPLFTRQWGDTIVVTGQIGVVQEVTLSSTILTEKYFQSLCAINLAIHKALVAASITMPYPQRDVHIISGKVS